jgi:hypothetical protein
MNPKQILSITLVILGVLTASAAQLTDLVGAPLTKVIISLSSLSMSMLAGIQGVISGQSSLVSDVQSMPGVEKIVVNEQANKTLATMAVDSAQNKIETKVGDEAAIKATANGVGTT